MLVQEPSVKSKTRVRTTGCNGTSEDLPQAADRDTEREEESGDVSLSFLFGDYSDVQQTREMKKNDKCYAQYSFEMTLKAPLLKSFAGSTHASLTPSQLQPLCLPSSTAPCCSAG